MLFNLRICVWTILYTIVWILLKSCCWFNPSLWSQLFCFPSSDVIQLMCSFQAVYYYRLLRDTLIFPLHVLEPPYISLDWQQGYTLASNKYILLTFARYCSQGTTLLPTVGTPTPNSMRSSWDFLLGRSPDMLTSPTPSTQDLHSP